MIHYIFLTTPEKTGFQWEWVNAIFGLFCVIVGALLGFGLTILKEKHDKKEAEKKEKEDFLELKRSMPVIFETIKKGLDKNKHKYQLVFMREDYHDKTVVGGLVENDYFSLIFGDALEKIPKKEARIYRDQIGLLVHSDLAVKANQNGSAVNISTDLLTKIKKYGHLK